MAKAKHYIPNRANAVTPYLVVRDGQGALAWYQEVLGATVDSSMEGEGGAVMHAETPLRREPDLHGPGVFPGRRRKPASSPRTPWGGTSTTIHLYVPDVDAVTREGHGRGRPRDPGLPRTSSGATACRTSWTPSGIAGASRPTSRTSAKRKLEARAAARGSGSSKRSSRRAGAPPSGRHRGRRARNCVWLHV